MTSLIALGLFFSSSASALSVVNPGFNDTLGWSLYFDPELANPGGADPWYWTAPAPSTTFLLLTETVLPLEGSGMGMTYAGYDRFVQDIIFPSDGSYTMSVFANSISGWTEGGSSYPLTDGEFAFVVDQTVLTANSVLRADGWKRFEETLFVSAGSHSVGFMNTRIDPYSIAYDVFVITPEPSTALLLSLGLVGFAAKRRRVN